MRIRCEFDAGRQAEGTKYEAMFAVAARHTVSHSTCGTAAGGRESRCMRSKCVPIKAPTRAVRHEESPPKLALVDTCIVSR